MPDIANLIYTRAARVGSLCLQSLLFASCRSESPAQVGSSSGGPHTYDRWPTLDIRVSTESNPLEFRAFDCATGKAVPLWSVDITADIPSPNEVCKGEPRGTGRWNYGESSEWPCPPLRPNNLYHTFVWGTAGRGGVTLRIESDGTVSQLRSSCGEGVVLPRQREHFCRSDSTLSVKAKQELCADVSTELPPVFDLDVSGSATAPVFRATDCTTGESQLLWNVSVWADAPLPESHLCRGVPGGGELWRYGEYAAGPCPSLTPGETYLAIGWGLGKGGATFRVEADGTLKRLAYCGSLAPLPRLAEHYCRNGEEKACGTDDLGALFSASASPTSTATKAVPEAPHPTSTNESLKPQD
jgi:hypothetical protein